MYACVYEFIASHCCHKRCKDLYLLTLKLASCKVLIGTLKSAAVKRPILYTVYIARPETGEDLFLKGNTCLWNLCGKNGQA
jgi:hypothetical protein